MSYGNKQITDYDTIEKIEINKTTKDGVKELIGEPSIVEFNDLGDEDWIYTYTRSKARAASFIPIVGLIAGGADMKTDTLRIRFSKDGIVKKIGKGKATGGGGSIFD